MKVSVNEVTGAKVLELPGVLKSVSSTVLSNVNGTPYRVVNVELMTKNGRKTVSGFMYESNYEKGLEQGLKIGDTLLTRVENTGRENPLIFVSHLHAGERASNSDFDWDSEDVSMTESAPTGAMTVQDVESSL